MSKIWIAETLAEQLLRGVKLGQEYKFNLHTKYKQNQSES